MAKRRRTTEVMRCSWAKGDEYIQYHDVEWGVPVHDDRLLFEFLILEGALGLVSGTLVVSAVIGLCMLLLKESQRSDPSDADVNAILIGELVSEYPRLLPGPSVPPALSSRPPNSEPDTPRLTSAENITDDSPE